MYYSNDEHNMHLNDATVCCRQIKACKTASVSPLPFHKISKIFEFLPSPNFPKEALVDRAVGGTSRQSPSCQIADRASQRLAVNPALGICCTVKYDYRHGK